MRFWSGLIVSMLAAALAVPAAIVENPKRALLVVSSHVPTTARPGPGDCGHTGQGGKIGKVKLSCSRFL